MRRCPPITRAALATALSLTSAAPAAAQTVSTSPFFAMDEISVPIIDASRINGVLNVSVTLEARDARSAAELGERVPELRAAALAVVLEFARLHASPFTPVDVSRLAAALKPALRDVSPSISRILIVKVAAHEA